MDGWMDRQADKQTDKQSERERGTQTDRHIKKQRQADIEKEAEKEGKTTASTKQWMRQISCVYVSSFLVNFLHREISTGGGVQRVSGLLLMTVGQYR